MKLLVDTFPANLETALNYLNAVYDNFEAFWQEIEDQDIDFFYWANQYKEIYQQLIYLNRQMNIDSSRITNNMTKIKVDIIKPGRLGDARIDLKK